MKTITGTTVDLTDVEIDVVAYYERLLDEGKGITVAAFWALRMAALNGEVLTTEFALYLSEQTLVLEDHYPVVNRFCPLGADVVTEWLDTDPQVAAVRNPRALIAADFDLYN